MSSQQQAFRAKAKDSESISTEADSYSEVRKKDLMGEAVGLMNKAIEKGTQQHEIAAKVGSATFNADKICKFSSAILKVLRGYQLTDNLKACEKLGGQIGQLRRLLRVDRLLLLIKEFAAFSKKKNSSISDKLLILFKIMLLLQDITDLSAFLIQLRVIAADQHLPQLRRKVATFYFLQCIGWLIFYAREYYRAKNQQQRGKHQMAMLKYVLDGLCAHNQLSGKVFNLQPRTTCLLALLSGSINLYLVWK